MEVAQILLQLSIKHLWSSYIIRQEGILIGNLNLMTDICAIKQMPF